MDNPIIYNGMSIFIPWQSITITMVIFVVSFSEPHPIQLEAMSNSKYHFADFERKCAPLSNPIMV